jgi:hypothetical protein
LVEAVGGVCWWRLWWVGFWGGTGKMEDEERTKSKRAP